MSDEAKPTPARPHRERARAVCSLASGNHPETCVWCDRIEAAITSAVDEATERCAVALRKACYVCKGYGIADHGHRDGPEECRGCKREVALLRALKGTP